MKRRKTGVIVAAVALLLSACSGVESVSGPSAAGNGSSDPGPVDPTTHPPRPVEELEVAWTVAGAQFIAWDETNQRVVLKKNDSPPKRHEPGPMDITIYSLDPETGDIAWENETTVGVEYVELDFEPWPSIRRSESGARIGNHAMVTGGSRRGSSGPNDSFMIFTVEMVDIQTGEFVKASDLGLDCTFRPILDIGMCPHPDSGEMLVYDETLTEVARFRGSSRTLGPIAMNDYLYFGASFDYKKNMADEGVPDTFKLEFFDLESNSLVETEVSGDWYPDPKGGDQWGEFTDELTIIPLADAVLWNTGMNSDWAVIDPEEGVIDTVTAPTNVDFVDSAVGSELLTAEEFLNVWEKWEASDFEPQTTNDPEELFVSVNETPMLLEVTISEIFWSPLGEDPSNSDRSASANHIRPTYEIPHRYVVGPNSAWIQTNHKILDAGTGSEVLSSHRFLEHVNGLDIFSDANHGFNDPFDSMGRISAVHNPDN